MGELFAATPASRFAWDVPPDVRLCADAPVTRSRLERALAWWRRLGARFGDVERIPVCAFRADGAPLDRRGRVATLAITVAMRRELPALGLGGETRWACYGDVPLWAAVMLPEGADGLTVEHELGHALGFGHTVKRDHVMNAVASRLGTRTDGISFRTGSERGRSTGRCRP